METEYKNKIIITTGKLKGCRDRKYIFRTNQDSVLDYFKRRGSISKWNFPEYCDGTVEEYHDNGGWAGTWTEFFLVDFFSNLKAQNILSIHINGEDINEEIAELARKYKAEATFPLIYQVQFHFEDKPDWVFNWYPTTGTLTKQKTTDMYHRMKNLGKHKNTEEALKACV